MNFRPFIPEDAEFCFRVRSNAFIQKFYGELTPEEVYAGVNAYLPDDYTRMAENTPIFIVEESGAPVGFFLLVRVDPATAELTQLYIDPVYFAKGIGSACIRFMEKWLLSNWTGVDTIIVDTVIPKYNRGF
jgi:GNAT superfamily N-acetyltransferase